MATELSGETGAPGTATGTTGDAATSSADQRFAEQMEQVAAAAEVLRGHQLQWRQLSSAASRT